MPGQARQYMLPLGTTPLPAGARVVVRVRAQLVFRPERLIIADPSGIVVHQIRVRAADLLVGDAPAEMFGSSATGLSLGAGAMRIGEELEIEVSHPLGGTLAGAMLGSVLELPAEPLIEEAGKALAWLEDREASE